MKKPDTEKQRRQEVFDILPEKTRALFYTNATVHAVIFKGLQQEWLATQILDEVIDQLALVHEKQQTEFIKLIERMPIQPSGVGV